MPLPSISVEEALAIAGEIADSLGGRQGQAIDLLCRLVRAGEDTRPDGIVARTRRSSQTFPGVGKEHFTNATEVLKEAEEETTRPKSFPKPPD